MHLNIKLFCNPVTVVTVAFYSCGTKAQQKTRSWVLQQFPLMSFWRWTTWRQWSRLRCQMFHYLARWPFISAWEYVIKSQIFHIESQIKSQSL